MTMRKGPWLSIADVSPNSASRRDASSFSGYQWYPRGQTAATRYIILLVVAWVVALRSDLGQTQDSERPSLDVYYAHRSSRSTKLLMLKS